MARGCRRLEFPDRWRPRIQAQTGGRTSTRARPSGLAEGADPKDTVAGICPNRFPLSPRRPTGATRPEDSAPLPTPRLAARAPNGIIPSLSQPSASGLPEPCSGSSPAALFVVRVSYDTVVLAPVVAFATHLLRPTQNVPAAGIARAPPAPAILHKRKGPEIRRCGRSKQSDHEG